jgi:hypothetical protein
MGYWRHSDFKRRIRGGLIPAWLVYTLGITAIINFVAFVAIAEYLGGDALNGNARNGHYFLSYHGHLTEVSRAVFRYSEWHAVSVFMTHALAIFVGWIAFKTSKAVQP